MEKQELVRLAIQARQHSYCPYSDFAVGAALFADGKVYLGANVENASYGATICAERTAALWAIYDGSRKFDAMAVAGWSQEASPEEQGYAHPCGICRQFLREFALPGMKIYVARNQTDILEYTLEDLLPQSFGPDNLSKEANP